MYPAVFARCHDLILALMGPSRFLAFKKLATTCDALPTQPLIMAIAGARCPTLQPADGATTHCAGGPIEPYNYTAANATCSVLAPYRKANGSTSCATPHGTLHWDNWFKSGGHNGYFQVKAPTPVAMVSFSMTLTGRAPAFAIKYSDDQESWVQVAGRKSNEAVHQRIGWPCAGKHVYWRFEITGDWPAVPCTSPGCSQGWYTELGWDREVACTYRQLVGQAWGGAHVPGWTVSSTAEAEALCNRHRACAGYMQHTSRSGNATAQPGEYSLTTAGKKLSASPGWTAWRKEGCPTQPRYPFTTASLERTTGWRGVVPGSYVYRPALGGVYTLDGEECKEFGWCCNSTAICLRHRPDGSQELQVGLGGAASATACTLVHTVRSR